MGKIIIRDTSNDGYHFTVVANNHEVVGVSQTYKSVENAKVGIESIRANRNADLEDQTRRNFEEKKCPKWEIFKDKADLFRFRLVAANGEIVLAASEGYTRKFNAKKGIRAVVNNIDSEIDIRIEE